MRFQYTFLNNCMRILGLNDIIIVFVMVSDAYTITDTDLIPPKRLILILVSGIGASLVVFVIFNDCQFQLHLQFNINIICNS